MPEKVGADYNDIDCCVFAVVDCFSNTASSDSVDQAIAAANYTALGCPSPTDYCSVTYSQRALAKPAFCKSRVAT